jgi:hypothetical protein
VKAEVIAKARAVSAPTRSSPPTPRRCRSPRSPRTTKDREFHRHPFLLAGREDDAGRDHHGQEDRRRALATALDFVRASSRRRRSSSTTRAASTPTAASELTSAKATDADGGRAAGDDRERRPMAGMPVGPLSLNDEVAPSISPGRSCRRPKRISAPPPSTRSRKKLLVDHGRRSEGRVRPQERQGLLRLSREGPEEAVAGPRRSAGSSSIPIRSTSRS